MTLTDIDNGPLCVCYPSSITVVLTYSTFYGGWVGTNACISPGPSGCFLTGQTCQYIMKCLRPVGVNTGQWDYIMSSLLSGSGGQTEIIFRTSSCNPFAATFRPDLGAFNITLDNNCGANAATITA